MWTDVVWFLTKLGGYLVYISPPVFGVIVGGYVIKRYWVRRENESILIEYFARELDDLVDETIDYWTIDCKKDDESRQRARILESKIKGAIKNLNAALIEYSKRYCKKVDFIQLMVEVNDACTGGTFETAKRGPEFGRYLTVVNATHRVRWQLFDRRH